MTVANCSNVMNSSGVGSAVSSGTQMQTLTALDNNSISNNNSSSSIGSGVGGCGVGDHGNSNGNGNGNGNGNADPNRIQPQQQQQHRKGILHMFLCCQRQKPKPKQKHKHYTASSSERRIGATVGGGVGGGRRGIINSELQCNCVGMMAEATSQSRRKFLLNANGRSQHLYCVRSYSTNAFTCYGNATVATTAASVATTASSTHENSGIATISTACCRKQQRQQQQQQHQQQSLRRAPSGARNTSALCYHPEMAMLRRTNTTRNLESKRRVVKMLFVLVLEFFICWTPLYVINTITIFMGPAIYEHVDYAAIGILQLLAYSSSCCNPITYCFMNASFRRAFLDTFKGMQLCLRRRHHHHLRHHHTHQHQRQHSILNNNTSSSTRQRRHSNAHINLTMAGDSIALAHSGTLHMMLDGGVNPRL